MTAILEKKRLYKKNKKKNEGKVFSELNTQNKIILAKKRS